jgi:transposase-like protein
MAIDDFALRHRLAAQCTARGLPEAGFIESRRHFEALDLENRELRQANEILWKASAYFAQAELGRRYKS